MTFGLLLFLLIYTKQTFANLLKSTNTNTTTNEPSITIPTYEPTITIPTYEPTITLPTYEPTTAPTYEPTTAPTYGPTYEPIHKKNKIYTYLGDMEEWAKHEDVPAPFVMRQGRRESGIWRYFDRFTRKYYRNENDAAAAKQKKIAQCQKCQSVSCCNIDTLCKHMIYGQCGWDEQAQATARETLRRLTTKKAARKRRRSELEEDDDNDSEQKNTDQQQANSPNNANQNSNQQQQTPG